MRGRRIGAKHISSTLTATAAILSQPTTMTFPIAPELSVGRWFNTTAPVSLADLRGRVVMLHAFQVLCLDCVALTASQAQRAYDLFRDRELVVIGLGIAFEHHGDLTPLYAAITPISVQVFIREYRLTFPIGLDQLSEDGHISLTMRRYEMRGAPTTILIGRDGRIRHRSFGQEDDMALGAMLGSLLAESPPSS